MLTAAIVGCGRVVQVGHVLGFESAVDCVRVVALADPVGENRETVGDRLGVPAHARFADYRELLATTPCDFVDLALPHFLHEEAIVASAEAGRNILTEKPLTTSVASGARIASAVGDAGVVFGIHHNYTHFPHYVAMREAIATGVIGCPFLIRYESVFGGRHWPGIPGYDPDWRVKVERAGGGALIDPGYHSLYMIEHLMGQQVVTAMARAVPVAEGSEVDDLALTILSHAGGALSSVQVCWSVHGASPDVTEVHGSEGSLRVGEDKSVLVSSGQSEDGKVYFRPRERPSFVSTYGHVIRNFAAAVKEGRQPEHDLVAALHTLAVIMASYESERVREAVSVADIERRMR